MFQKGRSTEADKDRHLDLGALDCRYVGFCIAPIQVTSLTDNNLFDPWLDAPASPGAGARDAARTGLQISTIESVEPLDAQLGDAVKKTVPDALRYALFGQPKPSSAEIDAAGGNLAAVPPMQTYAILDAAKITNLPEELEGSELEHRCLFKGKAYDDLKNVAPWIVRLEDSKTFTRNLFTSSDAYWHLWDSIPGIYVRSRCTLDEMWRHFRKFTRIQTPSGRGYYLRFWDKSVLNVARREGHDAEFYQKLATGMTIIWHSPEPGMPNRFSQLTCEAL